MWWSVWRRNIAEMRCAACGCGGSRSGCRSKATGPGMLWGRPPKAERVKVRPVRTGESALAETMRPPFSFRSCRKENGPRPVQKKRTLRRVGPRKRAPPAAGGGRYALPRGSQGRKRVSLGVYQARGSPGYRPLLFPLALPWRLTWADEGVGPYGMALVGADAHIRPLPAHINRQGSEQAGPEEQAFQ